mgnify:CR=1 FL=1
MNEWKGSDNFGTEICKCSTVTFSPSLGVNSECVDSKCDCIRNGASACVASPPITCDPEEEGTCPGELKCHPTYHWCTCLSGALISDRCVSLVTLVGDFHVSYMAGLSMFVPHILALQLDISLTVSHCQILSLQHTFGSKLKQYRII